MRQGDIVGVTNSKDIVFFVAVLPQFVDVRAGGGPLSDVGSGLGRVCLTGATATEAGHQTSATSAKDTRLY